MNVSFPLLFMYTKGMNTEQCLLFNIRCGAPYIFHIVFPVLYIQITLGFREQHRQLLKTLRCNSILIFLFFSFFKSERNLNSEEFGREKGASK